MGDPFDAHGAHAARAPLTDRWEGELVVFLIGMRINRWWRPDLWVPVLGSMIRMLRELRSDPARGLLGYSTAGWGNPLVILQYWSSETALHEFATAATGTHLNAWQEYDRRVRATDAVGVWHETYLVAPGAHESVYVNMPPFGLAAAVGARPASGRLRRARGRMTSRGAEAARVT